MELTIIIVSYNTKDLLKKCLLSLIKERDDIWKQTEIIVVDNNSQDESVLMVKKEFPKVILIENKRNVGFSKANNQGIKIAKGGYIFLLNSDTELKGRSLTNMVDFLRKNINVGILAPRLLNTDNSVQNSVFYPPTVTGAIRQYWLGKLNSFGQYSPNTHDPVEVDAIVGAAMLIPKNVIDKVGMLNEKYFMYFEDLDYCRRVRNAGYKIIYFPDFEIIHHHGASSKTVAAKPSKWLVQSSRKYHGIIKYTILTLILFTGQKWQKIKSR